MSLLHFIHIFEICIDIIKQTLLHKNFLQTLVKRESRRISRLKYETDHLKESHPGFFEGLKSLVKLI